MSQVAESGRPQERQTRVESTSERLDDLCSREERVDCREDAVEVRERDRRRLSIGLLTFFGWRGQIPAGALRLKGIEVEDPNSVEVRSSGLTCSTRERGGHGIVAKKRTSLFGRVSDSSAHFRARSASEARWIVEIRQRD